MKNFFIKKLLSIKFLLLTVICLSAFFRFYGLNWDQDTHLHPDERFLTMVETALSLPKSINEYLNPKVSPLNPYNRGYGFFVYGTFPIFLTKYVGHFLKMEDYGNIHFVGRFLSGLFDLGTVFLLFLIGKKIKDEKTGLIAAFLYGTTVLAIQLSHFFAVDTFLNFFIILSFYFLINILNTKYLILNTIFSAVSLGLALACKISAILFFPIIILGIFLKFLTLFLSSKKKLNIFLLLITNYLLLITFCYLSFRFFQPYAFIENKLFTIKLNPQFIQNLKTLESFNNPNASFPPALQWVKTKPYVYPLYNILYWGLGLPLGLTSLIGLFYTILSLLKRFKEKRFLIPHSSYFILIVFWTVGLFLYQGGQFVKALRYFFPIFPFLCLLAANMTNLLIIQNIKKGALLIRGCFLALILVYPIAFMSIYSRPVSRVTASEWIYKNIPAGSFLANEHWDDALPLNINDKFSSIYKGEVLPLYDPDTKDKWSQINQILEKTGYIILSSNRLYRSIGQNPEKYPRASKYYADLFTGKLGFRKVIEFSSYPTISFLGLTFSFNDDRADENFTVFDHPKVIIFKRID